MVYVVAIEHAIVSRNEISQFLTPKSCSTMKTNQLHVYILTKITISGAKINLAKHYSTIALRNTNCSLSRKLFTWLSGISGPFLLESLVELGYGCLVSDLFLVQLLLLALSQFMVLVQARRILQIM